MSGARPALLVLAFIAAFWTGGAHAADICTAVAVRDVHPIGNDSYILRKGQLDEAITEYRVNKQSGVTSFCSHGGSCYPTRLEVGGDLLEALRLTNCRAVIGPGSKPYDDGEDLIYDVEPIRSKNSAAVLRYDDLDNKFLELGLCSACADNVTQYYIHQPKSRCALLARSALEGDPEASQTLRENPDYCVWHYPPS